MKARFWKSPLPGPFMLSFLLVFALIDYTIYAGTGSSPLSWVWKFLAVVTFIVSNFPLSSYVSISTVFLFGAIAFIGIILVMVSKGSALKAMEAASEKVITERPLEVYSSSPSTGMVTVGERDLTQNSGTAPSSVWEDAGAENLSLRSLLRSKLPDLGVTGKMVMSFAGIATLFGLGAAAIVYFFSFGVFETQINRRADVVAMNLSAAVAEPMAEKNLPNLRAELLKYAVQGDVAYIYVEDDQGNVLLRSVEDFPAPEAGLILQPSSKFTHWTTILYKGYPVYETRAGILDGKLGILHLGIWRDAVEKEILNTIWLIAGLILAMVAVSVMIFSVIVRRINQPLLQLAQNANRISEGELDCSARVKGRDEISVLAIAIERIRASLTAATKRLGPAQPEPTTERPKFPSQNRLRL
jgi:HAMP domain-containing protein